MRRFFPAAVLLLAPTVASAHLASTGLGPVYDGLYHLALTPRQIFPIAIFALYAGLRGPAHARWTFFILPAAWLAACLAGPGCGSDAGALACALAALAVGTLLATAAPLPAWAVGVLAAVLGLTLGCCYDAPDGLGMALGGFGEVIVLTALAASLCLPLRRAWTLIAVRVAGSWTAALGLLLVGWWFRGRAG